MPHYPAFLIQKTNVIHVSLLLLGVRNYLVGAMHLKTKLRPSVRRNIHSNLDYVF